MESTEVHAAWNSGVVIFCAYSRTHTGVGAVSSGVRQLPLCQNIISHYLQEKVCDIQACTCSCTHNSLNIVY